MKKTLLTFIFIITLIVSSCTENARTRTFGGTETIKLEPGEKVLMATWKDNHLFYMVEPMDSGYTPKIKKFKEKSSWGVLESEVIFIESK